MVEYVYARHDFAPEHEDEIDFRAGERIEVIEKDEIFNDGWWQGRNLAGKVGLFPESYTQPAPPSASFGPPLSIPPSLEPAAPSSVTSPPGVEQAQLQSQPENSSHSDATKNAAPDPTTAGTRTNGEVMRATLTDVQKAIEQLGHKDDFDGSQSFTFSSSHEDSTDQETDRDTDADQDWHKGARQKLAAKAKKVVEQAARDAAEGSMPLRSTVPPINVEMSDDSGDEADGPSGGPSNGSNGHRQHPHISEEEEEDVAAPHGHIDHLSTYSPSIQPSERFIVPSPVSTAARPSSDPNEDAATDGGVSTAKQSTFPQNEPASSPESLLPTPPFGLPPGVRGFSNGISGNDEANHTSSARLTFPSKSHTLSLQEAAGVLPSPAASLNGHQHGLSMSSVTSSVRVTASSPLSAARSADLSSSQKPRNIHAAEWTVEEVIDWLRSKGFDNAVCDKFAEQEITGDVLLELDLAILKSEIGIVAYGKRIRIANAIADLRRPPSILSSGQHTRPGSLSRGSPHPHQSVPVSPSGQGSVALDSLISPESAPHSGDFPAYPPVPARRDSDPGVRSNATDSNATVGLGLGIPPSLLAAGGPKGPSIPNSLVAGGGQNKMRGRPPQLSLSPSDPALAATAMEEDRGVLSESETRGFMTKSRGKLPSSPMSKGATTPRSDITPIDDGVRLRHPRKRSLDTGRETSRLSFFGNTLAGTLGKARKPPPRYSATPDPEVSPDRSTLSLSRFYYGSGGRKSSRSSASDIGGPRDKREKRNSKDSNGAKEKKDAVLRKASSPTSGSFKTGQSILEQIGQPDHSGWMRKKGEHYNTWKTRYFVLKGPHLYWLRSNNASETKIKGYINIVGYRMASDENIDPGRYGFKLLHDSDRSHFFSSDEQMIVRGWMRALMKATIDRDYTKPVVSSVNVPTIPLAVAQAMNPAPRPPSPTARAETQRANRRENTNQLSTRDAEILMSVPVAPPMYSNIEGGNRPRVQSFFNELEAEIPETSPTSPRLQEPPVRPPREMRRQASSSEQPPVEPDLIEWANSHLSAALRITSRGSICGGLELLRIAESIKGLGRPTVPDSDFPQGPNDDKLDGLLALFDFLLDNDVKMGTISINDVRQGRRDKIIQLLKALRAWEEKRYAVLQSIGKTSMQAGPFVG